MNQNLNVCLESQCEYYGTCHNDVQRDDYCPLRIDTWENQGEAEE